VKFEQDTEQRYDATRGEQMGLRDKLLQRVKKATSRFSGEYSAPAPEEQEPYERPGVPNEDAEVVMARLNRPKGRPKSS
jgi:hypothetical protein